MAVTKSVGIDVIRALIDMGVTELGESRMLELTRRAAMTDEWLTRRALDPTTPRPVRPQWHMVGHVQRNKVKPLLPWVNMIHSLDSLRLAETIDAHAAKLDRVIPVLLQVNAANEAQKFGVAVAAATHLSEQLVTLPHIELRGLMAMAPLGAAPDRIRATFERARELFDEIVGERFGGPRFDWLSMGMSDDFEYGIEAGATHIRIGRALFHGLDVAPEPALAD